MTKFNLVTLVSTSCLISFFLSAPAHASQSTVRLTTEPALDKIAPYEAEAISKQQPVKIKLQAIDPQGQPLKAAKITTKILNPPSNPWFSTDFPITEGTQLLELTTPTPDGKIELTQMLPIRGNYQISVNVTPTDPSIAPYQQTLMLPVAENGIKYQNFAILAGILLAVGATGGWVIGSRQTAQPGETVPSTVRLLLSGAALTTIASLLYININAETAQSGSHEGMSGTMSGMNHESKDKPIETKPTATQSGIKVVLSGDTDSVVGKSAKAQLQVTNTQTNQPIAAAVKISAVATEGEWTSFSHQGLTDSDGRLNWQSGFFDGVPHLVNVTVSPTAGSGKQFTPIQVSKVVNVEGVAPPLITRLIVLGYMIGIVAMAFFVTFWLHQRQTKRLKTTASLTRNI